MDPLDKKAEHTFSLRGWDFSSTSQSVIASENFKELHKEIKHFPTMSFPDNFLRIYHPDLKFILHLDFISLLKSVKEEEWWLFKPNFAVFFNDYFIEKEISDDKVNRTEWEQAQMKLKYTEEVIHHFSRVLFYEDEMDDIGNIKVESKLRVMSFGFYLLLAYHRREENINGRGEKNNFSIEYRLYYEFDRKMMILVVNQADGVGEEQEKMKIRLMNL